ncbi:diguanylate cyclase [Lactobacillus porci]|uniref:diguanylate cyclase n=1 Tax=Lactobacillus porci TaxID=2012477 RepID=UPI003992FF29
MNKKLILKKANKSDLLIMLAAILFLFTLNVGIISYAQHQRMVREREQTHYIASGFSMTLNEELDNVFYLTGALKETIVSHDGKIVNFNQVAQDLMAKNTALGSLQLAPKGKVTHIYPLKGNESGMIDLLKDPKRGPICRYGIKHNVTTLQGPFKLAQGGSGMAVRSPLFLTKNGKTTFWGFAIAIIRVPDIFKDTAKTMGLSGYNYRLYKNVSPLSKKKVLVMKSGSKLEKPVSFSFKTDSNNSWRLVISPKNGWQYKRSNWILIYVMLTDVLLVLLMLWIINRRIATRILEREASRDSLTQAYNRQGFDGYMQDYAQQHPNEKSTIIMLDVDDFKSVNDVFGHHVGDQVLVTLTKNLKQVFGPEAIVGRNGGDEFVVALPGLSMKQSQPTIEKMSKLKQTAVVDKKPIDFSISMGYSDFPGQARNYVEACRFADAALYEVKIAGKDSYASYKSGLSQDKRHNQLGLGMRALAAGDPTPLLVVKVDGEEPIYVNKSLLDLFNCELSTNFYDYYGDSFANLIAPDDRKRVYTELKDFIAQAEDEERFKDNFSILTTDARVIRVRSEMKYSLNQRYGALIYLNFILN